MMRKSTSRIAVSCADLKSTWIDGLRVIALLVALAAGLLVSGCHSAHVNATISNHGPTAISLVQMEYPSASFGTQTIAPGQDFKYRLKVLGSGTVKLTYTDAEQVEHKFSGPTLKESDEGTLTVVVGAGAPNWNLALTSH